MIFFKFINSKSYYFRSYRMIHIYLHNYYYNLPVTSYKQTFLFLLHPKMKSQINAI